MALITGGERAYQETGFMGSHGRSGTHGFFCRILSGSSTSDSSTVAPHYPDGRISRTTIRDNGASGTTEYPDQQRDPESKGRKLGSLRICCRHY